MVERSRYYHKYYQPKIYSQGLLLPNFDDSVNNEKNKIKLHRTDEVHKFIEEANENLFDYEIEGIP